MESRKHPKMTSSAGRRTVLRGSWTTVVASLQALTGAAWGVFIVALLVWAISEYCFYLAKVDALGLVAFAAVLLLAAVVGALGLLVVGLLRRVPAFVIWALIFAGIVLYASFFQYHTRRAGAVLTAGTMVFAALLGGAVLSMIRGKWKSFAAAPRGGILLCLTVGAAGLAFEAYWLAGDGSVPVLPVNAASQSTATIGKLAMPDPSSPGPYEIRTLCYGSGRDLHRPEYGGQVDLVTPVVDGAPFVGGWQRLRTNYWGFGPEAMPLNARVWYPAGDGPFPLALIVHGGHIMSDFSDAGYAYLGELLASRGFILASIDANFLNFSMAADVLDFKPLRHSNIARAWLLLEHLKLWKRWNATTDNPFYTKVDMKNIALMGHSLGGEAAAIATAFNRLPYYPDDATIAFDYGFDIRAVVAIAPVDKVNTPTGLGIRLENVNYLALHGTLDMDVLSFMGSWQYERVTFTNEKPTFKALLYIHGANHGQFNTVWGRADTAGLAIRRFNLKQVMPAEQQRQVAKVYITAFLEATLRGRRGYLPLFRDYRAARDWLPDTIYLNRCEDSTTRLVSTYEEDINVVTTTIPGGSQMGRNLTVWREQVVPAKWGRMDTSAVYLGWNAAGSGSVADYTITLPDQGIALGADSVLVFSLADANESPTPKTENRETVESANRTPIDLTIEVEDRSGATVRLPLSTVCPLQPQLETRILKAAFLNSGPVSEVVFRSFEFPLAVFSEANPAFEPTGLRAVRLVFDRSPAGVVILDNVGFRPADARSNYDR